MEYSDRIEDLVKKLKELIPADRSTLVSSDSIHIAPKVKLLPLVIKKLSGNNLDWRPFWELFEQIIHLSTDLNDVDKLNYLVSYLEGEAYQTLRGLTKNSNNYTVAIQLLHDKYDDKKLIITNHMNKLHSLRLVNMQYLNSLNHFVEILTANIRALDVIGVEPTQFDVTMTPLILNKIHYNMNRKYIQALKGSDWTMQSLIEFLNEEIELNEQCDYVTSVIGIPLQKSRQFHVNSNTRLSRLHQERSTIPSYRNKNFKFAAPHKELVNVSDNVKGSSKPEFNCRFYQELHKSKFCSKYSNYTI